MVRAFVLASIAVASILLGWAQPAVAQTPTIDPRWGLFAELAERDFHFAGWGGTKIVQSYRWEDPGRRLSYFFSYVGSDKQVMTLDEATGEIVLSGAATYSKYGDKYGTRLKVAADGTILWPNGRPFLSRGEGNTYLDAVKGVMVETRPGDAASEKVQRLIAAGKLRAANPGLRGAIAVSSQVTGGGSPANTPAIGAAVELNPVQRAALDRYVEAAIDDGATLQTAHWTEADKSFTLETISGAGRSETHYVVRTDGLFAMSPEDESKIGSGVVGMIDPATGKITMDWRQNGQSYRTVITAAEGSPGTILTFTYQGSPTRKGGMQWTEVKRGSGRPLAPETIATLVKNIQDQAKMQASPWGVLSVLPGTLWYCLGEEPDQWLTRRRMYQGDVGYLDESIPQMRFTVATWREPGRLLEITTKFGDGRGWSDVVELKGDGSFSLNTTGLSQHTSLIGHKDQWGQIVFPIANYNYDNGIAQNYIQFSANGPTSPNVSLVVETNNYPSKSTCSMQAYDASQLPRLTTELRSMQELRLSQIQNHINARNEFAADAAAGQQMVANMRAQLVGTIMSGGGNGPVAYSPSTSVSGGGQGASFLQDLQAMADTAHREAERSRAQLDATIARAQGGASTGASTVASTAHGMATSSSASAESGSTPTHSLTKKTIHVYFYIGTTPKIATKAGEVDDGHNTHCQSNIFPVTIDWDPSLEASGGNLKYANPVLDGMKSTFIDKCNRAAPDHPTVGIAQWYDDTFSTWHPESLQVRQGDVEVTMP
jgi:hypothetical protein